MRLFFGKPLIAYTIEAATESGVFERIIVSTDDQAIAETAHQYGAEIPFMRDASLSDDMTPVSLASVDALHRVDPGGVQYQYIAQLMANCPLRTADDIRISYKQFVGDNVESQISVTRYGWQNPWWAMRRTATNELRPLFEREIVQRSQDLPDVFCPTGCVWWAKTSALRREKTFHMAKRTGWEIPWQRAVDIDTEEDWAMAELLKHLSTTNKQIHG